MKISNLPRIIKVNKNRVCHECKKSIKRGKYAVFYWWIKRKDAYSHVSCSNG